MGEVIRIGSRASRLAIIQSQLVMAEIQRSLPDARLELVTMKTTGDKILNRTLDKIGGKGLFLKELDNALLSGEVDLCVHSLKDVPAEENPALPIGAYSAQESPGDVLVLPEGASDWDAAAPVGCASLRRSMQFQQLHPDAAFYHGDTLLDETAVVASDSVRLRNFGDSLSQFVVKLLKL